MRRAREAGRRFRGSGRRGGPAPLPLDLPLDNISAVLAFSAARKLRTAYTGDAIRVRESSGDTEADIGFDANGDLDEAALLSHCGSNDGFITKIYDQSGDAASVDFAQTTASLQPKIVNAGAVIKKDGKPAMQRITSGAGIEYVESGSWGTRPSTGVYLQIASYPVGNVSGSLLSGASLAFSGTMEESNTNTTVDLSAGTPSHYSNNSLVGTQGSGLNRDDMYTAFATDSMIIHRAANVDFSNAGWAVLRTGYTFDAASDGPEFWSELIILDNPSSEAQLSLQGNQGTYYGITLS